MKLLLVKGGFRHEGVKYDNEREMEFPENLDELVEHIQKKLLSRSLTLNFAETMLNSYGTKKHLN